MNLFNKKKSNTPRRRLVEIDADKTVSSSDIFRRNRTLSGVVISNTKSPRKHVHHLVHHRRKVLSLLIISLLAAFLLWTLISNFTATIAISISNTGVSKPVDSSRYEKAIQSYLDANPIGRFHFFLDQAAMTKYVSSKLPEVSSVYQRYMVGLGKTDFTVTLRVPVAGWKMNDKQYYVDSKGIAFGQNWLMPPDVQIVDNSGASPQGSATIISNRFLSFVGRIVSLSKSSGFTVTQAILPVNTTRELELNVKESSIMVKLSIDRPAGEQVEDMSRALRYFASLNQSPTYIDVRVSGKAFYK